MSEQHQSDPLTDADTRIVWASDAPTPTRRAAQHALDTLARSTSARARPAAERAFARLERLLRHKHLPDDDRRVLAQALGHCVPRWIAAARHARQLAPLWCAWHRRLRRGHAPPHTLAAVLEGVLRHAQDADPRPRAPNGVLSAVDAQAIGARDRWSIAVVVALRAAAAVLDRPIPPPSARHHTPVGEHHRVRSMLALLIRTGSDCVRLCDPNPYRRPPLAQWRATADRTLLFAIGSSPVSPRRVRRL